MKNQVIRLSGALLLLVFSAACVARNEVVKIPAGQTKLKDEGVFYALPRTIVKVELPIDKTEKKEGKYRKFTQCFFFGLKVEDPTKYGEQGITVNEPASYQLSSPVLTPEIEPDPAERFMVKIKGHYLEDKNMSFDWTEEGFLTKGVTETTNKTVDVIAQGAQTAISLIGKAVVAGATAAEINDARTKVATACASLEKNSKGEIDPDYPLALDAYEQLFRWQQGRVALVTAEQTGSPSLPADTLQLKLKEIDSQIKAYRSMFFGTEAKETWTARFGVTPLKSKWPKDEKGVKDAAENKFPLFRFSPKKGVCGQPKNEGEVSFLELKVGKGFQDLNGQSEECRSAEAGEVFLKLKQPDGQLAGDVATSVEELNGKGKRGFYYRIPATITAGVFKGEGEIKRAKIPVAQLGLTASLPASTGSRRTKYEVELYANGALKNFKLGSDALITAGHVKDFGTAAGTALDKRAELEKAEAAASNELNQTKKLREQLQECQNLKKAQTDLGLPVNLPKFCNP